MHMVRFDPGDGSRPTQSTVKNGTLAAAPQQNPQRDGFQFDGWTYDSQPFDFRTPILQDMTLKAKWTRTTDWTLSPDHGPAAGAHLIISPPDKQELYYVSIQAAGEHTIGLTGDGRIYTWTQDSTPRQIPIPAKAPQGFRYLQAATGSQWQTALGSDQRIYAWNSQQTMPTILDTGQNTEFTSISTDNCLLLAVDQQSQVHVYQASQADSQDPTPKFTEQATTRLHRQAQAVLAVASSGRILIVDTDGQVWKWQPDNAGSAKPEHVEQNTGMRIVDAASLNTGDLLLDSEGQVWYLDNSTTSMTPVSLPESTKSSRITTNKNQAVITGMDGRIWTWKPGETPMRADSGNQPYTQATSTDNRISAISRQGSMYTWSPDAQGNPGKPAEINAATAPTLETASMDSQPLKLSMKDEVWQVDMPARKPGPAAITLTGRQDNQPFTRSLVYTVDQPLLRDTRQGSTYQVTFKTGGGKPEPGVQKFSTPYGRVKRPSPDPAREGYLFDGWFIGEVAYDFSKPVTASLTLTAHWTSRSQNNQWSINPDKGSQLGNETTVITPPDSTSRGIRFSQVSGDKGDNYSYGFSLAVGSDGNAYAWGDNTYGQLGNGTTKPQTTPVMVKKPDTKTYPDRPTDFTYVQVSAGYQYSLALGSDGYVYAWGYNNYGQLGNNTTSGNDPNPVPVRVRDPANPTDKSKGLKTTQVSAGGDHSLALGSDGYVYAWGNNYYGQLGNNTSGDNADSHVPVRVRDPANPDDASKGLKTTQVSAGYSHSLALGSDGYAYAWGTNYYGQLGNNTSNYNANPDPVRVRDPANPTDKSKGLKTTQVSAGENHSLALGSDGYTYAWGRNYRGQLGNNTSNYNANPDPVRVRDPANPDDASKGLKTTQISAGGNHSLALGSDGYAYAWGNNEYGQLGNNTSNYDANPAPVRVRDPANPDDASKGLKTTQISAGEKHSLAIDTDGNAKTWGNNDNGQLGDDATSSSSVPVPVAFNLQPMITSVRFDQTPAAGLERGDGTSVTVTTPAHEPGIVTVSVDYTLGGAPQEPYTSLQYTYTLATPAGVLPQAGGEGILLAMTTGIIGMGGVLASRRHRREIHRLLRASHE